MKVIKITSKGLCENREENIQMVREIIKDTFILMKKSEKAGKEDIRIARDLLDTLNANKENTPSSLGEGFKNRCSCT